MRDVAYEERTTTLDRLATQEDVSRAELIRQLLNRVLANADASPASDLRVIDDSFGALADIEVPARGESGREAQLAPIWPHSS